MAYNLPTGVMLSDIDPPICEACQGHGEIEVWLLDFKVHKWITCKSCGGLGTPTIERKRNHESTDH